MDEARWFFRHDNRQVGPLTHRELAALCGAACLSPTDEVSMDRENWLAADTLQDMSFGGPPPTPTALAYQPPPSVAASVSEYGFEMMRQTIPYLWISMWTFVAPEVVMWTGGLIHLHDGIRDGEMNDVITGMVWLGAAALYLPPIVFLFRCASHTKQFVWVREPAPLDAALAAQKSFWKYVGILSLICLALYALAALAFGVALLQPKV